MDTCAHCEVPGFELTNHASMPGSKAAAGVPKRFLSAVGLLSLFSIFYLLTATPELGAQTSTTGSPIPNVTGEETAVNGAGVSYSSSLSGVDTQTDLPDEPQSQSAPTSPRYKQTKRILGIIPNFRSVSTDEVLPPQSTKEKFRTTTEDSFDYSSIVIPALLSGYSMGTDAYPEFHQGAAGYGRYFWHAAVDQTSENYMVEFFGPVLTHEDSRYYTMGRGGLFKRTGYAVSRAFITRSDSGKEVFNISEIGGSGASAGLSSLYYPTRERSFSNTATEWGLDVGIDAATFVFKEFWPDINHHLFRGD